MGSGDRTVWGSALRTKARQGAPSPAHAVDEDSMSTGMFDLVLGWGGRTDPREDDERLAAIRNGPRFARPVLVEPPETSLSE